MLRFANLALIFALILAATAATAEEARRMAALNLDEEPVQPVQRPLNGDAHKTMLGKKLFHDPRLSANGAISCATCHSFREGGAVNQRHSPAGASGKQVPLNVPTMFGSGLNFAQFWDGRAATLEDQIDGPLTGPDEMGSSWPDVLRRLNDDPIYVMAFREIYGAPPNEKNVKNAIAAFERAQTPADSPFDRYLLGDAATIGPTAQRGYARFKDLGCAACHQGQNIGGNMFQKFGILGDYFSDRGNVSPQDLGRFNVTGQEEDRHVFKVPSLRNVALTAPYFHDGSAATLEEAVKIMARYQLGHELSPAETAEILAFLQSLTGKLPEQKP